MKITKWYYDLVSDSGEVFIGYGVYLNLFKLKIPWRAVLLRNNTNIIPQQGIGKFQSFEDEQSLSFTINKYKLSGQWAKTTATTPCQLISSPNLNICWQGLSLNAPTKLTIDDHVINGLGYVERLNIDFKTAHLPFKELHWGRFISESGQQLLTWIKFDGPFATTQVFDGQLYDVNADISQNSISYYGGILTMQLKEVLLETNISSHIPYWLEKLFGGSIVKGKENKWLSQGTLKDKQGMSHTGWVIHEIVKW